jgi:hypothetical protein
MYKIEEHGIVYALGEMIAMHKEVYEHAVYINHVVRKWL